MALAGHSRRDDSCWIRHRYYRKAKALQVLSRTSDAIDTLTGALSKANLAAEKGLKDALVEAYGGFPETVRTFVCVPDNCLTDI